MSVFQFPKGVSICTGQIFKLVWLYLILSLLCTKGCRVLQEFLVAVSEDAKVLPALRDQLTELEKVVKIRLVRISYYKLYG